MRVYANLKLKYEFEIVDMAGETVAVPIGEGAEVFHGIIKLKNELAKCIFENLKEEIPLVVLLAKCVE